MKPDDIPQDVFEKAVLALYGAAPDDWVRDHVVLISRCARAIMAETEACAALAADRWKQWGHKKQDQLWRVDVASCTDIASAIRKRATTIASTPNIN